MVNPSGNIVLNGITDKEMVKIWEFKAQHSTAFSFNPQQFQPSGNQGTPFYNNVSFAWAGEPGLKVMHEILGYLLKKEEKAEAVGQ
jgi:hypothetical protein